MAAARTIHQSYINERNHKITSELIPHTHYTHTTTTVAHNCHRYEWGRAHSRQNNARGSKIAGHVGTPSMRVGKHSRAHGDPVNAEEGGWQVTRRYRKNLGLLPGTVQRLNPPPAPLSKP